MKVLTIGAAGKFAGLVLPELIKRQVTVRALVQDQKQADAAQKRGASEIAIGDLRDRESLRAATQGVEGVFHLNPAFAPDEAQLGIGMIEAAKASGVRKFVFSAVMHPTISAMTNHSSKAPVEEALYDSGLVYTVLQPTLFMQTIEQAWESVRKTGKYGLPYSKRAKVAYVDYRDVAEAAAVAMTSARLDRGTFELCGGGMVDRVEVAAMMSQVLGREVEATEPSFDEWADAMHLKPGPRRDGTKRMHQHYDKHGLTGGNALVLTSILGREPRSLLAYLNELPR